ncbi:MAG TPA: GAF domain-containing SpoIIE family protein phosphatase [Terriglobales bacterium]|nr:GAF domain-containing SpoIIE family protein phosphatase [Terriglobales bacterium]
MATSPLPRTESSIRPHSEWFVHDLLKLQKAAQAISSTLDLDELLNKIVNEVAAWFDCIESSIWLHDESTNEMVLAAVKGCTMFTCCGARLKVGEQGMIGHVAAVGTTCYAPDVSRDPYFVPCEEGTNSELDIPLKIGNKVIGVFSTAHHELDGFPLSQRRLLEVLCQHIAVAVQNAQAYRSEVRQREQMQREAREARVIQQSLLPKSSPFLPGLALEATSVPAGEVGGDWYDYIDLGDDRWGIVLADVAGKGMAAALLMSATRGILRSLARAYDSPAEVLSKLNLVLRDDFPAGRYVTMIYGVLDAQRHTITFANAGHPHPVLVHGSEAKSIDAGSGLPLGLAETLYNDHVVELAHGNKVVFYTDGISEAEDRKQDEFGTRRICEHMLQPHASADSLLKAACAHSPGPPADDATVILLRCTATA